MADGSELVYWRKRGEEGDWGTGRWSLCALRTEHSTLVFVGEGNEKELYRPRMVSSTQARQGMPWHENTDTKRLSKLECGKCWFISKAVAVKMISEC